MSPMVLITKENFLLLTQLAFENNCYQHLEKGVIILDIKNTYIEDDVFVGQGTVLYPGVFLRGKTKIGILCAIEPQSFLFDSLINNYVNVKTGSYIEASIVGELSVIGPYASFETRNRNRSILSYWELCRNKKVKNGR